MVAGRVKKISLRGGRDLRGVLFRALAHPAHQELDPQSAAGMSGPQSSISTMRAISPAFIARNASLMSPRRPRRVTISSSMSRPWR
jgi:hypothetical protein